MLNKLMLMMTVCGIEGAIAIDADLLKEEKNMNRVLDEINISTAGLKNVLSQLGLTLDGTALTPKEGRIATNLIVPTQEKGKVLVRVYPEHIINKLETGTFDFEAKALSHLSKQGLNVPTPFLFKDNTPLYLSNGYVYMVYPFISGNTLKKEDLSEDIAVKSGQFIAKMIKAAIEYKPAKEENLPEGDINYIKKCYTLQAQKFPQINTNPTFSEMKKFIELDEINQQVSNSPKGIVHSDFFFENFVINGDTTAAIDFGDAYYGSVAMDIAIAAMEFSAVQDQAWNFDFIKAFLKPNLLWLKENGIDAKTFVDLIKVNCVRFAIYTTPFTINDGQDLSKNPYVLRFEYLDKLDVLNAIKEAFQ